MAAILYICCRFDNKITPPPPFLIHSRPDSAQIIIPWNTWRTYLDIILDYHLSTTIVLLYLTVFNVRQQLVLFWDIPQTDKTDEVNATNSENESVFEYVSWYRD